MFGCSLDRNALVAFCKGKAGKGNADFLQMKWCFDESLNTRVASMFHPGVGYNGDLEDPFYTGRRGIPDNFKWSTMRILDVHARRLAQMALQGDPDLVVVDSSLWDLSAWVEKDGREVSDARVRRWCQHDLPGLLAKVSDVFPSSRVVFRTAPNCQNCPSGGALFGNPAIDQLYKCITSSTRGGKLFDKYEVVDYYAIVKNIPADDPQASSLYESDGYHPSWYASLKYVNETLRLLGVTPSAPDTDDHHHHHHHQRADEREGDPDDSDFLDGL